MAHQHVGALPDVGALEQSVQFARELLGVPGLRAALAPAHPSAIVGANARGLCECLLDPEPVSRHITEGAIQDHGRAALAYAVDVQLVAAHVDHLTGWRSARWSRSVAMAW